MTDITAIEDVFLDTSKKYVEDIIEYSDTIADIHNDIHDNKQNTEDKYTYVMDHINDEYNRLQSELDSKAYDLECIIDVLKQMIEDLQK